MAKKDTSGEDFVDPSNYRTNPILVGRKLTETREKIKFVTLHTLGDENVVWINKKNILSTEEFDDDVIKLALEEGSEIYIETLKKIQVGALKRSGEEYITPLNSSTKRLMRPPGMWVTPDGGGSGGGGGGFQNDGCGNCDWVYITHCTSCSDSNSSSRCARPFFPY